MSIVFRLTFVCVLLGGSVSHVQGDPVIGQLDVSPAEQNWGIGGAGSTAVTVQTLNGPSGNGDAYLQYISDGVGSAGRMMLFNGDPRWSGNYLTSGVTAIELDVRNPGATNLELRLALGNGATSNLGSWFVSASSVLLPPSNAWTTIRLPLASADMTQVQGTAAYDAVLGAVTQTRILSSVSGLSNRGDQLAGTIHVDNLRAIPEPNAFLCVGLLMIASPIVARFRARWVKRNSTGGASFLSRP